MNWEEIKNDILNFCKVAGYKILEIMAILICGIIVISLLMRLLKRLFNRTKLDNVAAKFLLNTIKFTLYMLLIICIAQVLSIPMTGFIALISAAGLAISLALQSSLSNLANGVVLISTKPFKEGDYVKLGSYEGTITEIKMLTTILTTSDNKRISIPNKKIVENEILNYSTNLNRRIELTYQLAYTANVNAVKDLLMETVLSTDNILLEPAPFISMGNLKENSIEFLVYAWVETSNHTKTKLNLNERIFNELKRNKFDIAYNQLEVRIKNEKDKLPFDILPAKKVSEKKEQAVKTEQQKGFKIGKLWGKNTKDGKPVANKTEPKDENEDLNNETIVENQKDADIEDKIEEKVESSNIQTDSKGHIIIKKNNKKDGSNIQKNNKGHIIIKNKKDKEQKRGWFGWGKKEK